MKKLLLTLLFPLLANAQSATFDAVNNVLTVPALTVSKQSFSDVKIRLDQFAVLSAKENAVPATTCNDANLSDSVRTQLKALIRQPVSREQLIAIVGCDPTFDNSQKMVGQIGSEQLITANTYELSWKSPTDEIVLTVDENKLRTLSPRPIVLPH